MRLLSQGSCGLIVLAVLAGPCWGQRGVRPPAAPPRPAPVHPVVPYAGHEHSPTPSNAADDQTNSQSAIFVILAGLGTAFVVVLTGRAWAKCTVAHLRILQTPPGDAPEKVRRAWIGVELPLNRWQNTPRLKETVGVLSDRVEGYAMGFTVAGRKAVNALATQSPDAASWWQENAPHVLANSYQLFFPLEVCERVT
jgi:hypothetical protein